MRVPVLAYIIVISAMVALAVGTIPNEAHALIPIGALLFYLSDIAVARDRFVEQGLVNFHSYEDGIEGRVRIQ